MKNIVNKLERLIKLSVEGSNWISCAAVMAMTILVCADVVLRAFKLPILGSYDLVCLMSVILIGFAVAYTYTQKGHISIDIITSKLPPRLREGVTVITTFLGVVIFSLLVWQLFTLAERTQLNGEISQTLAIPIFPFIYCIAIALILMCLVLLLDLVKSIGRLLKR